MHFAIHFPMSVQDNMLCIFHYLSVFDSFAKYSAMFDVLSAKSPCCKCVKSMPSQDSQTCFRPGRRKSYSKDSKA